LRARNLLFQYKICRRTVFFPYEHDPIQFHSFKFLNSRNSSFIEERRECMPRWSYVFFYVLLRFGRGSVIFLFRVQRCGAVDQNISRGLVVRLSFFESEWKVAVSSTRTFLVARNLHACTQRSMSCHACHCITFGSIVLGSGRSSSSNKSDPEFEEKKKCMSQFGAFLHMDLLLNLSILATFHGPISFDNVNKSSGHTPQ
jgi:hypothetical protein